MKKIIVSISFIFAFIAYTLSQYFGNSSQTAAYAVADTPTVPAVPAKSTAKPQVSNVSNVSKPAAKTVVQTPISQPQPAPAPVAIAQKNLYADGTYVGSIADAYYGNVQVQAVIQNGKIVDVQILQYPSDRSRSVSINTYAMPILRNEAISLQSANVDIVSGATDSSQAFGQSLGSALAQARNF